MCAWAGKILKGDAVGMGAEWIDTSENALVRGVVEVSSSPMGWKDLRINTGWIVMATVMCL